MIVSNVFHFINFVVIPAFNEHKKIYQKNTKKAIKKLRSLKKIRKKIKNKDP
jgi:ABC-type Zn uptake system ZnuABC Zn-binding protein ZnuA